MSSIGYNIKNDLIKSFNNQLDLKKIDVVYNGSNQNLVDDINLRIADLKTIKGIESVTYENYIMKIIADDKTQMNDIINELTNKEYSVFSNYIEYENLVKTLNLINIIMLLLGGIALVIAIINISNSINISINNRKYEIGVMRAIGIRFKDLKLLFFLENIFAVTFAVAGAIIIKIIISPYLDKFFSLKIPFSFSGIESITKIPMMNLVAIIIFIFLLVSFVIANSLRKLKSFDVVEIVKGE
ncbi:MAG: FtsX-like permease family protein [Sarcina sp.]